jgi:polyisoprenoid-binding protein YceI
MKKILGITIGVVIIILIALLMRNEFYQPEIIQENTSTQMNNTDLLNSAITMNGTYVVNTQESIINWSGKSLVNAHFGTINITQGAIIIDETNITGDFILNMNSIISDSTDLNIHLKSADFFDVQQYPEAKISIKGYSEGSITADVTIKNVTREITLPIFIEVEDTSLFFTSTLEIDRTAWGIVYNSGSIIRNLGDRAINDMVGLEIAIRATK